VEQAFGTCVLIIAAAFCLLTTLGAAVAPANFAGRLGLSVANAGGTNEVRAQYAGFFLAVAVACGAALGGELPRSAAYVLLAVVFGGLTAGRIASLALNRGMEGYSRTICALYVIDATGFGLATAAWLHNRQGQPSTDAKVFWFFSSEKNRCLPYRKNPASGGRSSNEDPVTPSSSSVSLNSPENTEWSP
jgi:hypothetical protein